MSPRERNFVREYVWGEHAGVGSHAAVAAGYAKDNGKSQANRLLSRPPIRAAVDKQIAEREGQLKHRSVQVAVKVFDVAMNDEAKDQIAAAKLFLQYAGRLKDKLELGGPDGGPLQVSISINRTVKNA